MKSTSVKGLSNTPKSMGKSFASYTGNVKSSTNSVPAGKRMSPAGGKVTSNLTKKVVLKKPGAVYK